MATHYDKVRDLVEIVLGAVAQELDVSVDSLSIEMESIVTRGIMESYRRGAQERADNTPLVNDRPTQPAPRNTSIIPTPKPRRQK